MRKSTTLSCPSTGEPEQGTQTTKVKCAPVRKNLAVVTESREGCGQIRHVPWASKVRPSRTTSVGTLSFPSPGTYRLFHLSQGWERKKKAPRSQEPRLTDREDQLTE